MALKDETHFFVSFSDCCHAKDRHASSQGLFPKNNS